MPKRKFKLDTGGHQRLVVSWRGFWKNTTVSVNENIIGNFKDKKELMQGKEFTLGDGTVLNIKLGKVSLTYDLIITKNGQPLAGSAADPEKRLKIAYGITFFIGAFNLVVGIIAEAVKIEFLKTMGIGWYSAIFGGILLVLAYLVKQKSALALGIAMLLLIADMILGMVFIIEGGGSPRVQGFIVKTIFIFLMFQGFGAIKELKKNKPL